MLKTRLGLPANIVAAVMYLVALFGGGYLAPLVLAGYILLFEDLNLVRRAAVKSIALLLAVSVINFVVYLIPDFMNMIQDLLYVFDEGLDTSVLDGLCAFTMDMVNIAKNVFLALLGVMALFSKSIDIKPLNKLADK